MSRFDDTDDPRRRILIQALAAGLFSPILLPGDARAASLFGDKPEKLAADRSIYRLSGKVLVNGTPATIATRIGPNDMVETGPDGEIVFVVGKDSYILRGGSKLKLSATRAEPQIAGLLRLLAGKVLAVFGGGSHRIDTVTATVGVRGTGVYVESDPEQTYFCTCYGVADMAAMNDKASRENIVSKHHDKPRYILANAPAGQNIRPAPMINHTDQELMLIESIVGRTPPFVFPQDDYTAPRRDY